MSFSAIKMCNFKGTCLESLAAKHTASGNEAEFVRTGVYKFEREAVKLLESHFAETIERRKKNWQSRGIDWSHEPWIGKLTNTRHPGGNNMVSAETHASQRLYYISGLYRAIKAMYDEDEERKTIYSELSKYDNSYSFHFHSMFHDTRTIEDLRKLLKDAKRSDSELAVIQNNEWAMDQLATGHSVWDRGDNCTGKDGTIYLRRVQDGAVVETITISPILLKRLAPQIEERRWHQKVEAEAKRRVAQQKAHQKQEEEKMRFEQEVQRRMAELR